MVLAACGDEQRENATVENAIDTEKFQNNNTHAQLYFTANVVAENINKCK